MANDLIENAALAAAMSAGYTRLIDGADVKGLSADELSGDDWRDVVRAVLAAIRNPSIEFQDAAFKSGACDGCLDCWRAMLDATLAE